MAHHWVVKHAYDTIPPNAVHAGNDLDGDLIYVGRSHYSGELLPAKVLARKNCAYVSHSGREVLVQTYEILTGHGFNWIPSSNGAIVPGAVPGGNTVSGETLYIGRAHISGSFTPGKIHPSHSCLYVPFNMEERKVHQYEILVAARGFGGIHISGATFGVHLPAHHMPPQHQIPPQHHVPPHHHMPAPSAPPLFVTPGFGGTTMGQIHASPAFTPMHSENWVRSDTHSSHIPPNAVLVGHDKNGEAIYVGRAFHGGDSLPAKIVPARREAYVSFGGEEISVHEFEILCGNGFHWTPSSGGNILPNAVSSGRTSTGEELYIGRGNCKGVLTPGKIHVTHGCLYVPYGGKEHKLNSYEVLARN